MTLIRQLSLISAPFIGAFVAAGIPASYLDSTGETQPLLFAARVVAGLVVWMAIWWMFEPIPIYATALLPLVVLPLVNVASLSEVVSHYTSNLLVLFLGGFILALALQRWGLHQRIAMLALRYLGATPRRILAALMGVSAFLSMWMSNTSTTLMMVPIAEGIVSRLRASGINGRRESIVFLLGVAYAASIGGIGTIVGSPPNAIAAAYLQSSLGIEVSFTDWMSVGLPIVLVMVPLTWALLSWVLFPFRSSPNSSSPPDLHEELAPPAPMRWGEWIVLLICSGTALMWMIRLPLKGVMVGGWHPFAGLTDAGIAITAALMLFVIPMDRRCERFAMDWECASQAPWGIFLLFGGGLSLAASIESSGLSGYLGANFAVLQSVPLWAGVAMVIAVLVFLTEITSNTATVTTAVPILVVAASSIGQPAPILVLPAAIAGSFAFMLPTATAPNAIVYGTGEVPISTMIRAGFWLNCLSIVVLSMLVVPLVQSSQFMHAPLQGG
jgi:sodium-dependent dicarboxylate transporter 2/3/5